MPVVESHVPRIRESVAAHTGAIARYMEKKQASRPNNDPLPHSVSLFLSTSDYLRGHVSEIRKVLETISPELAEADFERLDRRVQDYFVRRGPALQGFEQWAKHTRQQITRMAKEFSAREAEGGFPDRAFERSTPEQERHRLEHAQRVSPITTAVQERIFTNNRRFSKLSERNTLDREGTALKLQQDALHCWLVSPAMKIENGSGISSDHVASLANSAMREVPILSSSGEDLVTVAPQEVCFVVSLADSDRGRIL